MGLRAQPRSQIIILLKTLASPCWLVPAMGVEAFMINQALGISPMISRYEDSSFFSVGL
jgi:hypothetical protein